MHIRRLVAALALVTLALAATPTAAQADSPYAPDVVVPKIGRLTPLVTYSVSKDKVFAKIRYQCTNNAKMQSFLVLSFHQPDGLYYNLGSRNDNGGMMVATCTGRWVTKTIGMSRTSYAQPGDPYPHRGVGHLWVAVAQQSIQSLGGFYVAQGPSFHRERDLMTLRTR